MTRQVTRTEAQVMNTETKKSADTVKSNNLNKMNKQRKFERSTSLERIMKFNSYICSQNFFILPALLAWLRKPHEKLHDNMERFIATIKCIVFTTFLPRLAYKLTCNAIHKISQSVYNFFAGAAVMHLYVYCALASVFIQLGICLYYLSGAILPAGFLFMCTCLYLISQMNYKCLLFSMNEKHSSAFTISGMNKSGRSNSGKNVPVTKRLSRRDLLLGQRTISNINLL